MRPALLLPLLLAAASPALAQAPARATVPVVRFRVAETDTTWVRETRCTDAFSDGTRACRRLAVQDGEGEDMPQDSARFWIEGRNGRLLARWAVPGTFYQSLGFDLVRLDLDGDGQVEHVVAHHESEGNGLGVRFWMLYVVDGRQPERFPLAFASMEHGDDAFVHTPRGWRLLAGAWEEGVDPRRGEGLYFAGRLFRYDAGRLAGDAAQPVRRRRYLNTFANERGRTYEAEEDGSGHGTRGLPGQTPWRWLQHRSTVRTTADPELPPTRRRLRAEPGRYLGTQEHEGELAPAFLAAGEPAPLRTPMVVVQGGRVLPLAYAPAGGWPDGGAPARLVVYAPHDGRARGTGGEPVYVVELD